MEPYAAGGEATVSNIQLRCHAHNAYEARLFFGDSIVSESRTAWGANSFRNEFDTTSPRSAGHRGRHAEAGK